MYFMFSVSLTISLKRPTEGSKWLYMYDQATHDTGS